MWFIIYEVPGGLLLFGLVLLMALTDSAGSWVIENMALITAAIYIVEGIQGILRCKRYKERGESLWLCVPFTALSIWASTSYILLVIADIAVVATGGLLGLLGLVLSAPLALISCVICKGPNFFVNMLAKDGEVDGFLAVMDGVITFGLCMLCRWFFGFL